MWQRCTPRGLSLAPTLTTDDGVWYAVPAHITGDIAGPNFASTRRKDHAAGLAALATEAARRTPGAMVLNVECALHLLTGGPHSYSYQYTGRPLCKRS